jgi:hypothetical protein
MIVILYDAKTINPEVSNVQHAGEDDSIENFFLEARSQGCLFS